ncbi:MAG: hypothetical protein KBE23_03705 [Chloroflexi bacterium]|nr:hypothetical protein [Chloroflexota bacterium]MBP7041819.1 hypothetical protein [Chloroflexota bacterium]
MLKNRLIVVGFFMVLTGAVLPFLIVMGVLESTFFLNFLAFATSVIGVFLGILGAATMVGQSKRFDDWE